MTSDITLEQFIDAIEKNNYAQGTQGLFYLQGGSDDTLYACALGQGLLNAGLVKEASILRGLKQIRARQRNRYGAGWAGSRFISSTQETNGYRIIKRVLGDKRGTALIDKVVNLNDSHKLTCQEIAKKVRNEFRDG